MTNFELLTAADIAAVGNKLLNKEAEEVAALSTSSKLEHLATLLAYKKMLDARFAEALKLYEDNIDLQDFNGVYNIGKHKVTFKVNDEIVADTIGITREKLREDYNIADSIITKKESTMYTLNKKALEEAINNQIPEVLDAIRDGKLSFTKSKTKTSSVK